MTKSSLLAVIKFAMVWLGVVLPTLLFFILAVSSSADVVSKSPELGERIDSVRVVVIQLVPSIDFYRHARSTSFPEVAALTTTFAVFWVPVMTISILAVSIADFKAMRGRHLESGTLKGSLLSVIFGPFLAIGSVYMFFAVPGDPSSAGGLTTHSRLGYSVMAIATIWVATGLIGFFPVNVVNLLKDLGFIKGE
jgi:hypothetical protein